MLPRRALGVGGRPILRGVRARMLTAPSRVHSAIPTLTNDEVSIIVREVRDALNELGSNGGRRMDDNG